MISHIDHLVLTVSDIERAVAFYSSVLNMEAITFGAGRRAVGFGNQKINLQLLGQEPRNRAQVGSGDVCLITRWPLEQVMTQPGLPRGGDCRGAGDQKRGLRADRIHLLPRPGSESDRSELLSLTGLAWRLTVQHLSESPYFLEPDQNLIEVSIYP